MKVMKFGGTSVGSPERMKHVSELICQSGQPTFVVLSAMSGTTNNLVEIANYYVKRNPDAAGEIINRLEAKYLEHIDELYREESNKQAMRAFLREELDLLRSFTHGEFTQREEKIIVAQGEMISTRLVVTYLQEQGIRAILLPALDFMRTDANAEPDMTYIRDHVQEILRQNPDYQIYLTQGFVCRNVNGEVDNMLRGGSDYTVCLIGAAIKSEEIQIWTDIDGMHNNDPQVVEHTEAVHQLHFEEAAELAYFGAKILHPTCILPAKFAGVPVRLLNTMQPDAPGTIIDNVLRRGSIKAVAAKDNITAIKVKSSRMLLAAGFLCKIFEIFRDHDTAIDMVTTSEVGVSMSIDNTSHLTEIVDELKQLGSVTVDSNMCIICIVGDLDWKNVGFETQALEAMRDIPVRMISYGGSNYNISYLISERDKKRALQSLNNVLFNL